jgi:hypothetical protein
MQEALTSLPEEPKVAQDEDDPAARYADMQICRFIELWTANILAVQYNWNYYLTKKHLFAANFMAFM